MRILMILNEEFPPDYRVEKEAKSLIDSGHDVKLLCYTTQNTHSKVENYNGIDVRRFKINRKIRNKLHALYLILPIYRWIWTHHIQRLIREEKADVLHIHDLPLSDIGVAMKKRYGLKVVCDQHEYYSNWIGQNAHLNTLIGKIVKAFSNWKQYERKMLVKADLVITVEEPLRLEYIKNVGVGTDRIITVPNTPEKSFMEKEIDQAIIRRYKNNFVLFYLGGIDILRGIDIAIQALPVIIKTIPEVKMVLAGKVWKNSDPIKIAKKLNVEEYVDFVGWLSVDMLPSYIAASDVCFHIPPVMREENNKTIATKIYQYMMIGKPIICGQAKMMRELILQNEAGLDIKDSDSEDFAARVKELYRNSELREQLAINSLKTGKRFIWGNTVTPLIKNYEKMNHK